MKKIRIEKDITVRWSDILTNGEPVSLEGRDLKLYIVNPFGSAKEVTEFSVTQNNIEFLFRAAEQKNMGVYKLKLYENYGKARQTVLDQCEGLCLVSSTCQEGGSTEGLDTESVDLQGGNLDVGLRGLSAYEIAVNNGFVGTEGEWLESLHGEPGPAFTYDDLTEEQKEELARPGVEAANVVKTELNDKIYKGVNLLLGSDTTLLNNIATWQMTSATIAGKQDDGWWRVNIPNGTTDGEIFIESNLHVSTRKIYTQSIEIRSDGPLTANLRFHRANHDYDNILDDIVPLRDNHYRLIGSFKSDGYDIRPLNIWHINAPSSTYIEIRFPIVSETDNYIPWRPSIYDLTDMRQEQQHGGGLDDAPSDGNTYGRKDGAWTRTVGRFSNSTYPGEAFNSYSNIASGNYSHAEGQTTTASGDYSHAEGFSTIASGIASHAEGDHTVTSTAYSHAEGVFNICNKGNTDESDSIHMVGIGKEHNKRRNAHEIMKSGDHYVYGIGGYDGTNYSEAKTLQEVIAELTSQIEILKTTIKNISTETI